MVELTSEEQRWLTGLHEFDEGNALALLALFAGFRIPHSYLDVGCGTGAMVKIARQLGVEAFGVDILPLEEPYFYQRDLREPCDLGRTFDLVTSVEVAEHIAPEAADTLCDTYARHVRVDGGLFILTAAAPGQNGDGHVNCQPQLYWRDRLTSRGLKYDEWATQRLVRLWADVHMCTHWLETNLQVFHRYEVK